MASPIRTTLYSTSNCDYQAWQCALLDATFQAVGQAGELVRLCSEEPLHPERPFEGSRVARVLCMPSWARNERTSDRWAIANKPASMELWLGSLPRERDDDAVLFLDPDMVFLEPVELEISPGQVVGQRWVDRGIEAHPRWDRYGAHVRDRITRDAIPMYPFCATVGDMRRIVRRFREISQTIRDENPDCWEADMYGLVIAMHEAQLRVETRDDLGVCNNWEQRTGPLPKLIHYPARVLDEDGRDLWFKQSYTPATRRFPWARPADPERAANPLERRLLEVLHEHVDRQEAELARGAA